MSTDFDDVEDERQEHDREREVERVHTAGAASEAIQCDVVFASFPHSRLFFHQGGISHLQKVFLYEEGVRADVQTEEEEGNREEDCRDGNIVEEFDDGSGLLRVENVNGVFTHLGRAQFLLETFLNR